jgi:hypothetical protein
LNLLKGIASKLKGHNCEKMVKRIGNELSLTLPNIDVGAAKINMGLFSNKIVELVRASGVAAALDNSQYLICRMKGSTDDSELRKNCERIYLQIVLALTQLESIIETIKIDPSPEIRTELSEWIKYCSSLNKHAIETVRPGTSGKGPGDPKIEDIMNYQNITQDDMNEALVELEEHNLHTDHQFESGYGNKVPEQISDVDEGEIRYLINKYEHDSQVRYDVLKRLDELSRTRKLYQSISFLKFLRKISKNEDKNEIAMFFYILHNLFLISKEHDKQKYSSLVANYKPLLSSAFIEIRGRYSYSQTRNILVSLNLNDEEWCELHWKRIKNAITTGFTREEIEKIYGNITFLRNKPCKSLPRYRGYLAKRDENIEIKKVIESLLIAG